ncbi:MAG: insulinase family protein [Bacteroidia bacterium]|nr:insulinase family protein [Bacteroidia bacterium]
MRDCSIIKLSNGIRIVHQYIPTTQIVHCGIFLGVGSRDETPANQGIAHFWEHMAFKGTRRRKAFHIINSLDAVGGELNAYTDKERVVFYASVRNEHLGRAVDILSDITFHSIFPENEIEKERGVILEEMAMYMDDPDDTLQDEFEHALYGNHPLGMNILGTPQSVRSFRRRDFKSFVKSNLSTDKIVFSCIGNVTRERVEQLATQYFEPLPTVKVRKRRKKFSVYQPTEKILERPVKQAKCAFGRDAFSLHHADRIPFYLLTNILGGPGMNSRLNLALRERRGYVYSVEAVYVPYSDTGMFAVFFGTKPRQLDRCISLVKKEMAQLADKPLSQRQLHAAKEQVIGQLAIAEENNLSLMMMMGRTVLDFGRVPSLVEIFDTIADTKALKLQQLARTMFDEKRMSA